MSNRITKILSAVLAVLLILANSMTLISYAADNFMSENELENQEKTTNESNVSFDVMYENGKHTNTLEANQTGIITAKISVKNGGYVKNAVVDFEGSNFIVSDDGESNEMVSSINENELAFNQINSGTTASKNLIIQMNSDNVGEDVANKDNEIKLKAIYVDGNGKEKEVTGKVIIHTNWKLDSAEALISQELTKYVFYKNNLIVQSKITENIVENVLPVKSTNITLNVPVVNDIKPSYVSVISNTEATNANTSQATYEYNQVEGTVAIIATNSNANGKISWSKNSVDEFLVTYVYELTEEQIQNLKNTSTEISYNANLNLETYSSNNLRLTKTLEVCEEKQEEIGTIADIESTITENINKGYLYNNIKTSDENKKETEFAVNYKAIIPVKSLVDSIIIEENTSTVGEGKVSYENVSYNRNIKISKEEFTKILGDKGSIDIKDAAGTVLTKITTDSTDVNGYFEVDLSAVNYDKITVETSKPVSEGIINVTITKALRKDLKYSSTQIENLTEVLNKSTLKIRNGEETFTADSKESKANLQEPTLKAIIETNKETLSTVLPNEGVEFRVTLENDTIDDKMFSEPEVQVKLPANIKELSVKSALYYDEELSIDKTNVINNSDGTKTIKIIVLGTQTKYNNVAAKGATIVINADITLEELTPTVENNVELTVTSAGEKIENSCFVKYVAPTGVVATNAVTYQNDGEENIMSLSSDEQTGLIPVASSEQEVTFNMNVINNYSNTISNVVVLGRIPAKGNGTNSNLDLTLSSQLTVAGIEGATVYYSDNISATTDLDSAENGWTQVATTASKSYMIVLGDKTLNVGEGFKFSYKAIIPGNLDYDQYTYENYSVYYTNNQADGNISETLRAATTGLTTGTGPKFTASLTVETPEIKSGDILKYTLNVTNEGSEQADDVNLTIPMLSSMTYVEADPEGRQDYIIPTDVTYTEDEQDATKTFATVSLGSIAANSSISKDIWFKTTASDEQDTTISLCVTVANTKATVTTDTVSATLKKVYFVSSIYGDYTELIKDKQATIYIKARSSKEYLTNKEYSYDEETDEVTVTEKPYTGNRTNTILTINIPEELEITKLEKNKEDITSTLNVKGNTATINIGTLNYEQSSIEVTVKQKELKGDVYAKTVSISSTLKADNTETEEIGSVEFGVNKAGATITQTSNIPSNIQIGTAETFTYTFTIKNLSKFPIANINFVDKIPAGLVYSYTKVTSEDGTEETYFDKDENGNATATILVLGAEETAKVEVNVIVDMTDKDLTISNIAKISQEEIGEISSNTVTNKIKAYEEGEIINGGEGETIPTQTARIIGTVWIDANKNAVKDLEEQKVSNIKVLLLNNATGNVAKDANSNEAITTTDENGDYAFSNIYVGNYTVIFFYDNRNYSPTDYRKAEVAADVNSDAMDKTVIYEGETTTAAVTETITLTEDNAYNIDLGLVENKKFDFKLEKTVANITVTNEAGTSVHEYNKNFAKIDFKDKYADSSTMVVEYKLVVTNEGAIPGYVKKIADYLPAELNFSSELNINWYASTDGKTIYNNSTANTLLEPGQSIEVTLILTKKMTSNSIGITITNEAEIYETSNDYGIEDIDSTPGNKVKNEDDFSTANVLTSVQTGQTVVYVAIGLLVIVIIGGGVYLIKKKVIK